MAAAATTDCTIAPPPSGWDATPQEDRPRLNKVIYQWYTAHPQDHPYQTTVERRADGMYIVSFFQQRDCRAHDLREIARADNVAQAYFDTRRRGTLHDARGAVVVWVRSLHWDRTNGNVVPVQCSDRVELASRSATAQVLEDNRAALAAAVDSAQELARPV